ncbi:MAG: AtpZ/AtpI family protein [Holosporaceae bacterium]|jgi:ATP synthase protein I|nr:AtpZ/AtpI family protein [Holosporaceae bacterium]
MNEEKRKKAAFRASIGLELVSAVIVGILMGLWLDKRFRTPPLFLIIFFLFGCVAGYMNILKYMINQDKEK